METSESTLLDHIKGIQVPGKVFERPANEYWALVCWQEGMEYFANQVTKFDQIAMVKMNPGGDLAVHALGNAPGLEGLPKGLLTCAFHWYAISACQYVRTVGAIAYDLDNSLPLPHEYVKEVIPDVLAFKDKIAAHLAGMTRNGKDNEAERMMSLMPPLGFIDDSLSVNPFVASKRSGGTVSDSSKLRPWSLTKVHEQMRLRYWPNKSEIVPEVTVPNLY
jgi:hypothetical protein